jgi:hypothetical protein
MPQAQKTRGIGAAEIVQLAPGPRSRDPLENQDLRVHNTLDLPPVNALRNVTERGIVLSFKNVTTPDPLQRNRTNDGGGKESGP